MPHDYVPRRDTELSPWLNNLVAFTQSQGESLGLSAAQIAALADANSEWSAGYAELVEAQHAARAARQRKDILRTQTTTLARQIAAMLQASPAMTDAMRADAGLTVRVRPDERSTGGVFADDLPVPLLRLDWSQRGQITIHAGPNPGNEQRNGWPDEAKGLRIEWCVVAEMALARSESEVRSPKSEVKRQEFRVRNAECGIASGDVLASATDGAWKAGTQATMTRPKNGTSASSSLRTPDSELRTCPSPWLLLADVTRSPFVHTIRTDAPLTVAYRVRYLDRRLQPGPISAEAWATVSV